VVQALETEPEQDFLGHIYMTLNLYNSRLGQIFTTYSVGQVMSSIALGDVSKTIEEKGYVTIDDPSCGSGALLIAGAHEARKQMEKMGLNFQNHVLVSGQDADAVVALMCYIQISLLGIAGYFKIGNSLTDPMSSTDNFESYWVTPMYFSDTWETRRVLKRVSKLLEEGDQYNGGIQDETRGHS
jgi:type I restriction-modification system DNA methylase subunit